MQLVAAPERYQGKRILVEGWVSLEFEDYGLYLSHDDYDHLNTDNAVWIDFAKGTLKNQADIESLNGKYVFVEGVFDGKSYGHMGAYSGSIHKITRIEKMLTRAEYNNASGGAK